MYINFNCSLLVKQKYFSPCTIFVFFKKIPNYYILKLNTKNLLRNMYFAMITVICKIKFNRYNDKHLYYTLLTMTKTCTIRYWHTPTPSPQTYFGIPRILSECPSVQKWKDGHPIPSWGRIQADCLRTRYLDLRESTEDCKKLHQELHLLFLTLCWVIKLSSRRWRGMLHTRKSTMPTNLERPLGRLMCGWNDIKMDFKRNSMQGSGMDSSGSG